MHRVRLFALAAAALAATPLGAQQRYPADLDGAESCREIWNEYGRSMRGRPVAVHCEIRDVGVRPATGTLDVNGGEHEGVYVRGSKRSDVRVRLIIQAQGRNVDDARALAQAVKLDSSPGSLRVTGIDYRDNDDSRHFVAVTFLLETPEKIDLSLSVGYAPLDVENVSGRMELRAEHGPLALRNVAGDVRARVAYGPLNVDLERNSWEGRGLDAEAAYGPVTLRVPREFSANLEIGAEHGPMDIDFPITLTRFDRSRIETKLGAGGAPVRAVARYGPMALRIAK